MFVRLTVGAAAIVAALLTVSTASAAQDTTRTRDSLRVRDSLQRRDSIQRRDSLMRDSLQRDSLRRDSLQRNATPARATRDSTLTRTTTDTPERMGQNVRPARPTSQMRIRVQKEANGEVTLPVNRDSIARADSLARVEQMRADSIAQVEKVRQDSIAAIETARRDSLERVQRQVQDSIAAVETARRDSIARADSIVREEQIRQQRMRDRYLFNGSGWYLGVSGGSAMPNGQFKELGYDNGWGVNVPIGYHARNHLLGMRLDLGYSQFQGNSFLGTGTGGAPLTLTNNSPKVLSATLNMTARLPLNQSRSIALYGVGGGGLYQFRDFGPTSALSGFLGNDVLTPSSTTAKATRNEWGAQAGAGIDFGVGPASLFLESRLVNVFADRADENLFSSVFGNGRGKNVRWVPIVLGVTFR